MTMRLPPAVVVGCAAFLVGRANCQNACPDDPSTSGFSTISELNTFMEAELQLIEGGKVPEDSYDLILCPNTVFDTSATPLLPLLSAASFLCGTNGTSLNACTFEGGDQQIFIQDSALPTYPLETVLFSGITFQGFTENVFLTGTSINAVASSATTATFDDVVWTGFNSQAVVRQVPADTANPPMTVEITNSAIDGGSAGLSTFVNDGGELTLSNLFVDGHTATNFVTTTNRGSSTVLDSVVTQSDIERVTDATSRAVQRVEGVNITDMSTMTTTFYAGESGTSFILVDSLVENNAIADPWQVVNVQDGAVGQITGSSLSANTAMQSGIVVSGAQSVVSVEDSFLSDNVGLGPNVTSTPLFALFNSLLSVERTELSNNTEFSGQILNLFGSTTSVSRSCFQDGSSGFLAFVDNQGTLTASENFVSNTQSTSCPAPGNRLFVEDENSGCFTNGICEGACDVLADQSSCLAGIPQPTVSPTPAPTDQPTVSAAPSASPTTAAPTTSSAPSVSPSLTPTLAPIATSTPTLTPTRADITVSPTDCPEDNTKKPTKPSAPTKPTPPMKMKLGPRSTKSHPGMMKKVVHTTYYDKWVNAQYLQASEASDRYNFAVQSSSETHTDPPDTTCAPVGGYTSRSPSPVGKGKGIPAPTTSWGGKKGKGGKKSSTGGKKHFTFRGFDGR